MSTDEAVMAVWSSWTEATLQSYVLRTARLCGWLAYHTRFSIQSAAGFPDLVMVKGTRMLISELKREGKWPTEGHLSTGAVPHWVNGQREWLLALDQTAAEVYLWWPSDAHDIATILAADEPMPGWRQLPCFRRTTEYLYDAAGAADIQHGAFAARAVEARRGGPGRVPAAGVVAGAGPDGADSDGPDPDASAGPSPSRAAPQPLLGVERPRRRRR